MANCRSCDAEIIWAVSEKTGKPMPIDAAPSPLGNLIVINGRARVATTDDDRLHRPKYMSHFASCANAEEWRK